MPDTLLDAKGLHCPMPILKAKKALETLQPGDVLEIHSTDPGSVADFTAFCRTTGHDLLSREEVGGVWTYRIRKSG